MDSNPAEDLAHIRQVLDRHTRFLSLSGLSGVASGFIALLGAAAAYAYLSHHDLLIGGPWGRVRLSAAQHPQHVLWLGLIAVAVFAAALLAASYFTRRLAARHGYHQLWTPTSQRLALHLFICIGIGAAYCGLLVWHDLSFLVAPTSLIFYGLGLYAASKYTLHEIRYLGLSEITLGLIGMLLPGTGLLLWAIGFGLLNMTYGVIMYHRYEAPTTPRD